MTDRAHISISGELHARFLAHCVAEGVTGGSLLEVLLPEFAPDAQLRRRPTVFGRTRDRQYVITVSAACVAAIDAAKPPGVYRQTFLDERINAWLDRMGAT